MKWFYILLATALSLAWHDGMSQEHLIAALDGREFPKGTSRFALVIWSENYKALSRVENAESDGNRIAQKLHELSFDFVRVIPDASSVDAIYDGVAELRAQISASSRPVVVVFYFAGHGFQVDGDNHLVPIFASNASTESLVIDSASLTEISRRLNPDRAASLLLLFLDSCRTIRFLEDGSLKDFALREGLPSGFHEGNLLSPAIVSMAAAPRNPARSVSRFDGGKNSPFTTALALNLAKPGQSLAGLLEATRKRVVQDTDSAQVPWSNSGPTSTFFFSPRKAEWDIDERSWQVVRANPLNLRSCAQDYLLTYPTGMFAAQAEYLLALAQVPGDYCSVTKEQE